LSLIVRAGVLEDVGKVLERILGPKKERKT
jgi:hypothetical protein